MFQVDLAGFLSGDDIAFVYPDLRTAIIGTFVQGRLLIGQTCFLHSVAMEDAIICPYFTIPAG